jgi:hypothetical protein
MFADHGATTTRADHFQRVFSLLIGLAAADTEFGLPFWNEGNHQTGNGLTIMGHGAGNRNDLFASSATGACEQTQGNQKESVNRTEIKEDAHDDVLSNQE